MKANDIRALHDKTIDELEKQAHDLEVALVKARVEKDAGKLHNTAFLKATGDDIARIRTIMREKELLARAENAQKVVETEENTK